MQLAGAASWRFAEGIDQLPLVAMYARDALGLPVPEAALSPPALAAELPDQPGLLDLRQRATAGIEWVSWWEAVLVHSVRGHRGPPSGTDQRAWTRDVRIPEAQALFDPPEFAALGDKPALRTALQVTFPDAARWAEAVRRTLLAAPTGLPGGFDYELIRTVAEQSARRHNVTPDAVQACAVVLPVVGAWWRRVAPGAIACSVHAARDPAIAGEALTDAFESGLAA